MAGDGCAARFANSPVDTARDCAQSAFRNPENYLILLDKSQNSKASRLDGLVPRAEKGVEMKIFVALVALCAFYGSAAAQAPDCKSISRAGPRLACYDKAVAPVATPAAAKPGPGAVPVAKADGEKYVDVISAEDALMNARLKNICRGC
jgi:hypothetical protein